MDARWGVRGDAGEDRGVDQEGGALGGEGGAEAADWVLSGAARALPFIYAVLNAIPIAQAFAAFLFSVVVGASYFLIKTRRELLMVQELQQSVGDWLKVDYQPATNEVTIEFAVEETKITIASFKRNVRT